jgi:hypothetical protein
MPTTRDRIDLNTLALETFHFYEAFDQCGWRGADYRRPWWAEQAYYRPALCVSCGRVIRRRESYCLEHREADPLHRRLRFLEDLAGERRVRGVS